jgi:gliding motility-associated-like protein
MVKRLLWFAGFIFVCAGHVPDAFGQTFNYTQGGLSVNVIVSHPCDGSTSNGSIQFNVLSVNTGAGATKAQLVLISGPNEFFFPPGITGEINVGSSYTYIPPANQAGTYDFVIRDNRSSGADVISTPAPGAPFGVTLVDLPDLVIIEETLTNNSNCASPNGQVVASIDGGSKTPALAPTAGSFSYTWSSNNGLSGLPFNGTSAGVANLDLASLLGLSGLPGGTYTLTVDDAYSVCSETRDFTIIDPSPTVFNVSTLTPSRCLGSAGSVELSNSEGALVNYEIYLNGNPTGINQNGTGGALSFTIPAGTLSPAGSYNFTIRAVNGQCTPAFMNGTAVIAVSDPPTTSNAGSDQLNLCGVTNTTLAANTPTVGTGAWSIVSGTGGSFGTASSPTSTFSGTAGNTYTLRWTISNAPCTASTDDVTITFNQNPTTANAGPDQLSLCGVTSTTLAGNTATVGTGAWSIVSGTGGSFGTASSATSTFSGTLGTTYVLRWTISNAPCTASTDDVTITFNPNPTIANAGPDQLNLCGVTGATLAANTPTVGTGAWSIVSGTGGSFGTASSPTSNFSGTLGTTYVLRWTISNAPCTASTDDVTITFNQNPTTANAGPDQLDLCTPSTTLAANTPTVGTGAWSIVSGTGGSFGTASSPTSTFNGTAGTTYTLRWTISNAPCTASTDDVTITFNNLPTTANAGPDQLNLCGVTNTTLAANTPTIGTGAWSIVSGTGGSFGTASSSTSTFTGTLGNTYTLRWTISSAPCTPSTDDVTITFNENPTVSNAGPDQLNLCGVTNTTLAANTPTVGTGAWTIVSGTGGNITTTNSPTSTFTGTAGTTYTLRWTISNAPCTASTDDVTITFNENPTVSNAGADQLNLCGVTSTSLAGNTPTVGTGTWTIISGTGGSITTTNSPTSTFTGTAGTTYTLRWTISNAPCTPSTDDVTIIFNENPTVSNAGPDQLNLCGVTSTTLAANTPTIGTGAWSVVSGTGGSFGTASSSTSTFSGTAGTTYVLRWTISSAPCAASTDDVTITFNLRPTFTTSVVNVTSCLPGNDGSITITAAGGAGSYQYSNDGGVNFQPGNVFNGLAAGSYLVVVQDGVGCESVGVNVTVGSPSGLSATINAVDVTCSGGNDGSITISASGGNGSFTYSKDNGANFQVSNSFAGLTAGTYQVVVMDGVGCQFSSAVTINEPVAVTFSTAAADVTCNGSLDGSITILPAGGSGIYTYSKDGGANFQGSNVFTLLAPGPYSIQVKDGVGCISSVIVVTILEPTVVSFTANVVNATTCSPGNDGSITITASGGTGSYEYSKDNGATFQLSNVFTGLLPGGYAVQVRDANGCLSPISTETVGTPGNVTFTSTVTDVTCTGASNGIIAVTASGGNGVYTYSKDNGVSFQAGSSFTGLSAGPSEVVVRDGLGCLSPSTSVIISEPTLVTFSTSKTDATACGSTDGSIAVTPSGGTGQYFASIDNGANFIGPNTAFAFNTLGAGAYNVVVKDQNNCQTSATLVNILAPGSLSFSSVNQNVTCFGGTNGSITITASGGSGIYSYSKDNGANFQVSNVFAGLVAGTYPIVVNDGSGCQFSGNVIINQPSTVAVSVSETDLTCNGSADGSISITASGGTGTLEYSINNGASYQPSSTFTGLTAGSYTVLVKDANNCTSTSTPVTLNEPTVVTFASSSSNPTSCALADGSISITPSGGNGTYFASIDNGATFTGPSASFNFNSLAAGTYGVVVRDGVNCQSTVTNIILNSAGGLSATFSKTDVVCFGGNTGTISISASGGTGIYSYSIDNGANFFGSGTFNGLAAGTYGVVARDGVGCSFSGSVTINQTTAVTFTTAQGDVACNGGSTGSIAVTASGGNNLFQYSKDNGLSFQVSNTFSGLAAGSYSLVVKDGNACTSAVSIILITEPAVLTFTTSKTDASTCAPGNDGSIIVNASGGNGPYQYSRDGGTTYQVSNTFNGLVAGSYPIVVKDGNACTTAVTSVTIATPTPPDATFSGLAASYCTTSSAVMLTPMVTGGTFSGTGITGNTFSPATAGAGTFNIQYTITVSGCTSFTTQSVTVSTSTVDASYSGLNFVYCANATAATLTPTTAGGTFSGPGISGSTFDPATAGPGQHTIQYTVTSGGCTGTTSKIVTVLAATDPLCTGSVGTGTCASVIITPKPSPATCTNSDGKIIFSIKPFVPLVNNTGVSITITGVSITSQSISRTNFNDSTFLNLPVGTYDYSIQYGDPGCIKTGQVTIDQSGTVGTPTASNIINPTCAGTNTGSVVIDVQGETGNTLEWSLDGTNWTPFICGTAIIGLPQGPAPTFQHLISVRRNSSDPCNGGVLVTMQDVAGAITFSETITHATCANNDGSIQIGPISGGTLPYAFSFDGVVLGAMPANNTFDALPAGDYDFIVTDANACSHARTITVNFPGVVVITPVVLNPDCSGNGLNGAITVTVNSVGNFNVGISTDPLVPPTSFTNVTSGGAAVVNFANKTKGTYYITAQSTASLCPVTEVVTISGGPTSVDFVASTNDVLCFDELGTIQLNAITGEAGISYSYQILSGGNTVKAGAITALEALGPVDIQGISQGVYQVRLFQNQAACASPIYSTNKSLTIDGPDAVLDTLTVTRNISLPDQPTGLMNVVVKESGQEPYEFKLELIDPLFDEQSMPAIDWTQMNRSNQTLKIEQEVGSLYAGTYTLSLRDGFGCEKTFEVVIGVNTDLFIPNIFTPNDDGANEEFYIRNLPGNSKVVITDRWGKEIYASSNYQNDWRGGNSPDGIYYYKVIIGTETYSGWVEILRGQ